MVSEVLQVLQVAVPGTVQVAPQVDVEGGPVERRLGGQRDVCRRPFYRPSCRPYLPSLPQLQLHDRRPFSGVVLQTWVEVSTLLQGVL